MDKESSLEDFKKDYREIQGKYDLPSFEELNSDFQIEKAAENETDFVLREIRKLMADKVFNYSRFVESLLNPVNVPMFVFSIVKTLDIKEKEKLTEIYKKLAKNEVSLIELDIASSEEKEAEFIKNSYRLWQEIKEGLLEIVEVIKKRWDTKVDEGKSGYLG